MFEKFNFHIFWRISLDLVQANIQISLEDYGNFKICYARKDNSETSEMFDSISHKIEPNETVHFEILFNAKAPGVLRSAVTIAIVDNEFENLRCELNAEAYVDSVSLDNLPPLPEHLQDRLKNCKGALRANCWRASEN